MCKVCGSIGKNASELHVLTVLLEQMGKGTHRC